MERVVAFTGAGISKPSGIPTFNELGDIRQKLSREYFKNNPKEFYEALNIMKSTIDKSVPNNAHIALAKYNVPIVTMNIDGFHRKAGSKDVLEVHGNFDYIYCEKCSLRYDYSFIYDTIYCKKCGYILEPNIVLYGDTIPYYYNAIDIIGSADYLLVVGTSFYTSTANDFVYRAKMSGIKVEIINRDAQYEVPKILRKIFS